MANSDLRVRITADLADIKQGLGVLRGELAKVKSAAQTSAPNMAGWSQGIANVRRQLGDLAAAYIGFRAVDGVLRGVMDSFDRLDRIDEIRQMVALSSEELSKFAYAAQFSGVEIDALGKGFSFFQRNLAKNSELLQKLGVDAPTLAGKLRQLMDVFAALPDGPEKASLAAELFGSRLGANLIPLLNEGTAKFDELSEAAARTGNVFSDEATAGAAQFNDNLDAMKGVMTGVFNVAAQQLAPAMAVYAQTANESAKQSEAASEGGRVLANTFKIVAIGAVIVKNAVEGVVNVIAFLVTTASNASTAVRKSFGAMFGTVADTLSALKNGGPIAAAKAYAAGLKNQLDTGRQAAAQFRNEFTGGLAAMKSGVSSAVADVGKAFSAAFAEGTASASKATTGVQAIGGAATEATAKGEALRKMLAALFSEGGAGGKDSAAKEKAKKAIAGLVDQSALALDQVDRDLSALEQRFEDGRIKLAEYFAQKQALELQQIDLKIAAAEADAAAATSTEQQSRALTEIIKLQRDRGEIGPRVAREQAKAEKEAAAATLETLQKKQAAIQEELRSGTDYLAAQELVGGIGAAEGEQQLFALRQRSLEQMRALREAVVAYLAAQAAGSPEQAAAVAGLQQLDTEIAQVQASQQTFRNQIKDNFYTSLLSGFDTVRRVYEETGSALKAAKAGLLDFARSFVTALNRMAAEALAKNIMGALFKGGDSAGGGGGGGLMNIFANWLGRFFGGGSANGNIFGAGGMQKFAKGAAFGLSGISAFANGAAFTNSIVSSPTLFAFGKGGQFGVMGEAGDEAVMPLTRGPGGRLGVDAHGAGGASRVTTPIVVLGDRAVADALASTAGRDVVITHVMASIDKIRSAL